MIRLELTEEQARTLEAYVAGRDVTDGHGRGYTGAVNDLEAVLEQLRRRRNEAAAELRATRIPSMGPRPAWSLP